MSSVIRSYKKLFKRTNDKGRRHSKRVSYLKKIFTFFSRLFDRNTKWVSVYLSSLILGILFYTLMIGNVYSPTYDVDRFDRAKETIRSPITIENEVETERKMRETILAVSDRYTVVEEVTKERLSYIEEIFEAVDTLTDTEKKTNKEEEKEEKNEEQNLSYENIVAQLQEVLSKEITDEVDDLVFLQLLRLDEKDRKDGRNLFINVTEKVLTNGVRIENIQSAQEEIKDTIKYSNLNNDVKEVLNELIPFAIVENSFFDVEKTMEARNEAANNVEPVVIHSGDIIVREGQIITNEIYEDLKLVGVLEQERSILPGVGLFIFVSMLISFIGYELNRLFKRNELHKGNIITVILISLTFTLLMKALSMYTSQLNYAYLLFPIAAAVLLLKILITERLSMILSVIFALIASVLFNDESPGTLNIEAGLYFLIFQLAAIMLLSTIKDRGAIIKTSFLTAGVNVLTVSLFILLSFNKYEFTSFMIHASFGVAAAILSAILTIGLLPFFETGLGILSDSKLLQLANPNQPLLRKLLTEAPGTYHHSVMVANLSESACEAIGANGLLARVGAYYHDIGKTVKPHYFIENQVAMRNPHDFIKPEQSAKIIINHVIKGVEMLEKHKLPKEIIDIAAQHHGTSLVSYFYHVAKQRDPDVDEALFRYPGPKPQTKEAAIVSICDVAEAAVRSLDEPSAEKIESIVASIVTDKLTDGQLDDTPLTLHELQIIQDTVYEALKGIFHTRIQYPEKEAT